MTPNTPRTFITSIKLEIVSLGSHSRKFNEYVVHEQLFGGSFFMVLKGFNNDRVLGIRFLIYLDKRGHGLTFCQYLKFSILIISGHSHKVLEIVKTHFWALELPVLSRITTEFLNDCFLDLPYIYIYIYIVFFVCQGSAQSAGPVVGGSLFCSELSGCGVVFCSECLRVCWLAGS